MLSQLIDWAERGLIPDALIRIAIRRLLRQRLRQDRLNSTEAGKLAFVPLHSAHWSVPFMVCMQEKAAQDALAALPEEKRPGAKDPGAC